MIVGGLSFEPRTRDLLLNAAERYFLNPPGNYSHILGVGLTWIGSGVSQSDVQIDGNEFAVRSNLLVMVQNEFVRNAGYSGRDDIRLKD